MRVGRAVVWMTAVLCSAVWLLSAPGWGAAGGGGDTADKARQVEALFACVAGKEAPGAAVVVLRNGEVVLERGYGYANIEHHIPNGPETGFRLASITKSFTALAILRLQEEGLLNIDDPMGKYLPGVPNGDTITLRHLLTHTSGLRSSENDPLEFPPGERLNYSNTGYQVLGKVIEKVAGVPYEEYLRANVLVPAGLQATALDRHSDIVPGRASGYMVGPDGGYLNAPFEDAAHAGSVGGLRSTIEDMARWEQALVGGKLVSPATLAQAWTPATLKDGARVGYGLGWAIADHRGLREISHGGDITGFNSWVSIFPDQQLAVIVLSNIWMRPAGVLPNARDLGHKIAGIYLGDVMAPEEQPVEVHLDPAVLAAFAGRYRLEGRKEVVDVTGDVIAFLVEEGRLFFSSKVGKGDLRADSETAFTLVADPTIKIHFMRSERGEVTGAIIRIMELVELRATRLAE